MKRNKASQLKQMKISAFCVKTKSEGTVVATKRKVSSDEDIAVIEESPVKPAKKRGVGTLLTNGTSGRALATSKLEPRRALKEVANNELPKDALEEEFKEVQCSSKQAVRLDALAHTTEPAVQDSVEALFDHSDVDWGTDDPFFKGFHGSPKKISPHSDVSFSTPVLGTVMEVTREGVVQTLVIQAEATDLLGRCTLLDVWAFLNLSVGDRVAVSAVEVQPQQWQVDARRGYVSLAPQVLVSSTTLSGAMFCLRRAVLAHYHKGLDPQNKMMALGQMVHEILQKCLTSVQPVEEIVVQVIQNNLQDLYSCGMSMKEARRDIDGYLPRIQEFLDVYLLKKAGPSGNNFKGYIEEVVDIEDAVSTSALGLKGRIDVTVRVGDTRVMPLEVKTGRASFSNEHRSQVALYTMIMSETGKKVESGLLLYLKEGLLQEITPTATEQRDLLILRNQLVRSLDHFTRLHTLPDPIRSGKVCAACPYLSVCSLHVRHQGVENLSVSHPMRSLVDLSVTSNHIDYFILWFKLVCLENAAEEESTQTSNLECTMKELTLQQGCVEYKGEYKHSFLRSTAGGGTRVVPGSFVSVSTPTSSNITYGRVINVTDKECSVLLGQDLASKSQNVFSISLYKSNTIFTSALTNLATLLDESHKSLRAIIIDKNPPESENKLCKNTVSEDCVRLLKPLNADQRRAVLKVLAAREYLIVRGPPGTGKTQTIVALVQVLSILGQSVLIVGHTHSSVDNILLRLPRDLPFVRFGSLGSIHPDLHSKAFKTLVEACTTTEQIGKIYEHKIMAATCLGVHSDLLARTFDVCVVDESSQVLQPEVLRPLFCSKKFVLIGDSKQLAPVVKSREALHMGMAESLFERLEGDLSTVSLKTQYRMNEELTRLANRLTYEDQLVCGTQDVAQATLRVQHMDRLEQKEGWLRDVLSTDMNRSAVFVDTGQYFNGEGAGGKHPTEAHSSRLEAGLIKKLVDTLVEVGLSEADMGVVAPYRAQVDLIRATLEHRHVEVSTVDQYQGRDKQVILYSCTKENSVKIAGHEMELMNNMRRLTVAVTRAKHKLVVVGDRRTVVKYRPLTLLLEALTPQQVIRLEQGSLQ